MKKIKCLIPLCFLLVIFLNSNCDASTINTLQISRYATVAVMPSDAQINPLESVVQIHFPPNTQTIGQAINLLLNNTGFSLAPQEQLSNEVLSTLSKPLPIVDRSLGPVTIHQALSVLIGENVFTIDVNELKREVNFNLQKAYISEQNKNKNLVKALTTKTV